MRNTFKDLTPLQKGTIHKLYNNPNITKEAAQLELSRTFGVTERTIRSWANQMGLNLMAKNVDPLKTTPAKILVFDIETSPIEGYFWGLFKQNIGTAGIKHDWFLLTWSAKWLFNPEVMSDRLTSEEAINKDDKRVVTSLHKLLDEADIVIAHNGKRFDIKKIKARFVKHKLPLVKPFEVIDTLLHARKEFAITSNKLDYLGEFFGVGRKVKNSGMELWTACMSGDESALIEMETYNKGDVTLLEDVYLALRPYMKSHPNIGLHIAEDIQVCPTCGSDELSYDGEVRTAVNVYQNYVCNSCGAHSKSRKSISMNKSNLLAPITR